MLPSSVIQIGAIVLFLGGLIFIHELGHFVVAKALGVKVLRFSVGFGPRVLGFTRGETEYWISAFPLGGYVRMAGEIGDERTEVPPDERGRRYLDQSPWRRLLISVAGPAANLIFPGVVYVALAIGQNGTPTPGPFVGTVAPGTPAARAGLRAGDRILAVTAPGEAPRTIRRFGDLRAAVSPHPEQPLIFRVERDGKELPPLTIVPAVDVDRSNPIEVQRRGILGVRADHAPAIVAPAAPGAAGPLEPFDLVVSAGGAPVKNVDELQRRLADASCAPLVLEVVREEPVPLPGASLSTPRPVSLGAVPTCDARGGPAILPADPTLSTFIGAVEPGSPAAKAGLRRGDAIAAVNGKPVHSFNDINALSAEFLPLATPGVPEAVRREATPPEVHLGLTDGRLVTFHAAREGFRDEMTGERRQRWVLGFAPDGRRLVDPASLVVPQVPMDRSAAEIASFAWLQLTTVVRVTFLGIVKLVTGQLSFRSVGGPLMLFQIAVEAAEEGWSQFLFQMAIISVNLGLMNLLPIPVLDGGNIAQALLEGVTRRPISARTRMVAQGVGLFLLFALMILVFRNDIVRRLG